MFCSQCGAPVVDGTRFCPACGTELHAPSSPLPGRTTDGKTVRPFVITLLGVLKLAAGCLLLVFAILAAVTSGGPQAAVLRALAFFCLIVGAAAAACGIGLLRLRPFGRYLQIVFSIFGLLVFPFGTVISVLILVYMFGAGARVLFSGRPSSDLSAAEIQSLRSLQSQTAVAIAVVVGVLAIIPMTGITAAIAVPNFLTAIDRAKQKRTMADLRSIGVAVEAYAVDHNVYPGVKSIAELQPLLQPTYIQVLPTEDGWGHELRIDASTKTYRLWSSGKDGDGSDCAPGETDRFDDQICFENGQFVRYPAGLLH